MQFGGTVPYVRLFKGVTLGHIHTDYIGEDHLHFRYLNMLVLGGSSQLVSG